MVAVYRIEVHHGGQWLPWRTLLLAATALLMYGLFGAAPQAWVFDHTAISGGEWWRLLSGHWVHSDPDHAVWDIAALLLLGALFERYLGGHLLGVLAAGMLGVDAWLWWGLSAPEYYCGLSGILNALMVVGLLRLWQEHPRPLILVVAGAYVLKVVLEVAGNEPLFTDVAWQGVPLAHVAGLISGMFYTCIFAVFGRRNETRNNIPVVAIQCSVHRRR